MTGQLIERYLSANNNVKWLLRKKMIFAKQTDQITGYLRCTKFNPTKIINQLIDNCVRPGLYFASSIMNDVGIETASGLQLRLVPTWPLSQLGPSFAYWIKCDYIRFPLFPIQILFIHIVYTLLGTFSKCRIPNSNLSYPIKRKRSG